MDVGIVLLVYASPVRHRRVVRRTRRPVYTSRAYCQVRSVRCNLRRICGHPCGPAQRSTRSFLTENKKECKIEQTCLLSTIQPNRTSPLSYFTSHAAQSTFLLVCAFGGNCNQQHIKTHDPVSNPGTTPFIAGSIFLRAESKGVAPSRRFTPPETVARGKDSRY